jgi:hypothetical protein
MQSHGRESLGKITAACPALSEVDRGIRDISYYKARAIKCNSHEQTQANN